MNFLVFLIFFVLLSDNCKCISCRINFNFYYVNAFDRFMKGCTIKSSNLIIIIMIMIMINNNNNNNNNNSNNDNNSDNDNDNDNDNVLFIMITNIRLSRY